ncbi:surface antigen [Plasmodium falciparum UGT5.1]|uniref:Surface antigen n=1 Tax=Plasmodium falciparum UGT5.1 TaxID=1237627 RepID=W7JKV3_PLAFA|nr:surface antigen [Plasmodium falciparum UGT5.1]
MKVHYINISLFALPLNILVYNQRNHNNTTLNTQTKRSLCECELFEPANYDNDPQMKEVMDNFNKQTQQRFHEYDERMKTTRQKCKEQCDEDIQKIILKDKLEKELMDKFATLHTDIQSDAIPTCICEKSVADKMEKGCLRCGGVLGGGIAPSVGLLGGIGEAAISAWKPVALAAAKKAAIAAGIEAGEAAGIEAGKKLVIQLLQHFHIDKLVSGICEKISSARHYNEVLNFVEIIIERRNAMCGADGGTLGKDMCTKIGIKLGTLKPDGINPNLPDRDAVTKVLNGIAGKAKTNAEAAEAAKNSTLTAEITEQQTAAINATYTSWQIAITASVIAILIIVLIMVIIYLILRYRRKKKMKKKLQYIKLLEE